MDELVDINLHECTRDVDGHDLSTFPCIDYRCQEHCFLGDSRGASLIFSLVNSLLPAIGATTCLDPATSLLFEVHEVAESTLFLFSGKALSCDWLDDIEVVKLPHLHNYRVHPAFSKVFQTLL